MVIVIITFADICRGYKIHPSSTTSKSGQITQNIHLNNKYLTPALGGQF
jgi:hypothetical protein